ncbi:hypothetical protein D3C71_1052220 [compost metagenome]
MVVAARAEILLAGAAWAGAMATLATSPEQRREEFAELRFVAGRRAPVEFEALVPAGRRLEAALG